MKTAICLHGYFGTVSTGDFSTYVGGYYHIMERVKPFCSSLDFYVHCWQPEMKSKIVDLYNPKSIILEEQKDFNPVCQKNNINQSYNDENFPNRYSTMYKNSNFLRILSFYYSRVESLKLSFGKGYDCILTTRFDISQRGGSEVNQIRFNNKEDMNFLYTTTWNQKNAGYGDMWFYGSEKIMKKYSNIYENALIDFQKGSKYEQTLTSAWPDSNFYDCNNLNDPRQFTNEIDKEEKSDKLMKYPKWRVSDSHLHHKWFCMSNGLYKKTRWI